MPLMRTNRSLEAWTGAAVLLAGVFLLGHVYSGTGKKDVPGYDLRATFKRTDGLGYGAEVRMSGLVVGHVTGYRLDESYRAVVTLHLNPDIALPLDTAALIHTDGLLGAKYVELQPGGDDANIKPNGAVVYTQDSVDLVDLLEKIVAMAKARRAEFAKSLAAPTVPAAPAADTSSLLQGRSP
ncbi:MAG: outer membrane lipid asymmetry maintenance protein MlaD [Rhodospirillales bacterium]|nr:MAG: outer membrane lipid asymmetry maintenance protein MlaD [Rhodospirillales bacterium]